MHEEPSLLDYCNTMKVANDSISNSNFSCSHNNAGWVGYYLTDKRTQKKYCVVRNSDVIDYYTLYYYSSGYGLSALAGKVTNWHFKSLDAIKDYLLDKPLMVTISTDSLLRYLKNEYDLDKLLCKNIVNYAFLNFEGNKLIKFLLSMFSDTGLTESEISKFLLWC